MEVEQGEERIKHGMSISTKMLVEPQVFPRVKSAMAVLRYLPH